MWESGTLQKDEAKRGYSNLFKDRQAPSHEDPFENIEAILIQKLTDSAIELNSASLVYISVL